MLTSSILNSVTFKNISGNYPNMWNTLHKNRKQGVFNPKPYCQPFDQSHTIYLQFTSDQPTDLTLKTFDDKKEIATNTKVFATEYGTTNKRYFFNFEIVLDYTFFRKEIYFTVSDGETTLTSEPIYADDLSSDIASGRIKYIKYSNLDRNNSDLDNRFIDWSAIQNTGSYMDMFVEAIDIEPNDTDETEVLEGSQSNTIVSASYFSGKVFKTGGIPDYMVTKLGVMSNLDLFLINDIQYIKTGEIDVERYGNSTLYQASITLSEKNSIGINVDNLGIEITDIMEWHKEYKSDTISANFDIAEPEGYYVSAIFIKHANTSIPVSTDVLIGYSIGGSDIGEATVYKANAVPMAIQASRRGSFDAASRIYFTFSGSAGYVLRVKVLFQLNDI